MLFSLRHHVRAHPAAQAHLTVGSQGEQSFFEKKDQKTFIPNGVAPSRPVQKTSKRLKQPGRKSFLVLFFKKEPLASPRPSNAIAMALSAFRSAELCLAIALCAMAPTRSATANTLFEALGGNPGIARITSNALTLYFADPRLAGDFDNVNRDWLEPRFAIFLCHVADGPCVYKGRSMAAAHKGLHITQVRFNAVVEDLQIAMNQSGTSFRVQNRLLARLAPMEHAIVSK